MSDKEDFYKKLKNTLDETTVFPSDYLYKFIVRSSTEGLKQVKDVFDKAEAIITTKKSKNGKYTSISVRLKQVKKSEEIIFYYKEAAKIEGIISL